MPMARGEVDGRAENPDAPKRTRARKSRLAVSDADLRELRKTATRLRAARVAAERNGEQGSLL